MKRICVFLLLFVCGAVMLSAQPTNIILLKPSGGEQYRAGTSQDLRWDTTGTYRSYFKFQFATSPAGPWTDILGPKGAVSVLDSGATRGVWAGAFRVPSVETNSGYIRMILLNSDGTPNLNVTNINENPFTIIRPQPTKVDSVLHTNIAGTVTLSRGKLYGIDGFIYVENGGLLRIDPGTIIVGDTVGQNSAICVNRGGKIYAKGTPDAPIIMTSCAPPGQRARGDWGGLLLCGMARCNQPGGEAPLEGGIAEPASAATKRGWYGGTNDNDSSGVLQYVRVEFGGIAESPNNELNGLTMGAVGRGTKIEYVQVSHANDDSYEWFGGSVDVKHLIAYGGIDDDFDSDNGWRGRAQFLLGVRFSDVADVSTSQAIESDNDANDSENQPFTSPVFSNMTCIGGVQDTSWTAGTGTNKFNSKFGAAVQIRRNSRLSIFNSLFIGWPRGIEIANTNTTRAASLDSVQVRSTNWYGIKGTWMNFGSGISNPLIDLNWLSNPLFKDEFVAHSPDDAQLTNPFAYNNTFNPLPKQAATYLSNASFSASGPVAIDDSYFEHVNYRGAFGTVRWDLPWSNYDPVNTVYVAGGPTAGNGTIRLKSPNGGEKFFAGTAQDITWDTVGTKGLHFTFQFGTTVNGPWTDIAGATNILDDGTTHGKLAGGFKVPATPTKTGYLRMVLVNQNGVVLESVADVSDRAFEIVVPNVHLKSPNGGEKFYVNNVYDITWDTTGTKGAHYKFQFGTAQTGPWTDITKATNVTDTGATRGKLAGGFIAPATPTTTGYLRMVLLNQDGSPNESVADINDAAFEVALPTIHLTRPNGGEQLRAGSSQDLKWDTAGTYRAKFMFQFGTSQTGPWTDILGPKGAKNVLDSGATRGVWAGAFRVPSIPTKTGYIRIVMLNADGTPNDNLSDISDGAFEIIRPDPTKVDSVLHTNISGTVTLSRTKIYGIDGFIYVENGGLLRIDPGTIIVGDTVGQNSAICVNRGGKIYAKGTPDLPIVMTSCAPPGQRARGDWGGLLLCGMARCNQPGGEAPLEGGIAEPASAATKRGWYGGTNDSDSSGVLQYLRVEFGGIAESPNNELNGLTMGAVGRGTKIEYVQVSHANDDSYEWFGGSVDVKHLIAYGGIDDDFDSDNGWRGRAQFLLGLRFKDVADVSTSQAIESDNDASDSENQPFTSPVFSNMTAIGGVQDTSWTAGTGTNKFNSKFGAAMQIRRNSRLSLFNSVIAGWPRGIEIANDNTARAADVDSLQVRSTSWFGVKGTWLNLAGMTSPKIAADWIGQSEYNNTFDARSPEDAKLEAPFAYGDNNTFNPIPKGDAPYLNSASFVANGPVAINDPYFEHVTYRGAFSTGTTARWDIPWAQYDPVNAVYKAGESTAGFPTSVSENNQEYTKQLHVEAFPNPAVEQTKIRYVLPSTELVTIRVVNTVGTLQATYIENQRESEGYYEFNLDVSSLANGLYLVQIMTSKGTATQKVSVVH